MPVGDNPKDWPEQMRGDSHLLFHVAQALGLEAEDDASFGKPKRSDMVGIAVSGGSDSLALLHLFAAGAAQMGFTPKAVTVDHALRPESRAEATHVGAICAGLGIAHEVLVWDHGAIAGNLQDQARRARYRLLGDWARRHKISDVMIGHTADDQAETFLMGLSRAAGLDGLTGMRPNWTEGGVTFRRPLLGVQRAELQRYLTQKGQVWVDDPSNDNDRFARVKARQVLKALKPLGITVDRLTESIAHLASAQAALQRATLDAWKLYGRQEAGALHIARRDFIQLGDEIRRRLLLAAIQWLGNDTYAPRGSKIANLGLALGKGRDATLNGCRFHFGSDILSIYREAKAVKAVHCPTTEIWDKRWQVIGPHADGLTIRALGAEGLAGCPDWRDLKISRDVLMVSPAIWQGDRLVAAPLAGNHRGWQAKPVRDLNEVILSH